MEAECIRSTGKMERKQKRTNQKDSGKNGEPTGCAANQNASFLTSRLELAALSWNGLSYSVAWHAGTFTAPFSFPSFAAVTS